LEQLFLARSYTNTGLSFIDVVSNLAYCCLTGYTVGFPQVTALGVNYLMEKANGYNLQRLCGCLILTLWSRFFLKSPQKFYMLKKSSAVCGSRRFVTVNRPFDPILS